MQDILQKGYNLTDIPDSVRVYFTDYTIQVLPPYEVSQGEEMAAGLCELRVENIKIADNMTANMTRQTLLHEIIHAIDFHAQIGLTEAQVNALDYGILGVLRSNPDLAAYLLGD